MEGEKTTIGREGAAFSPPPCLNPPGVTDGEAEGGNDLEYVLWI